MSHPTPSNVDLAIDGVCRACLDLAAAGCRPSEVATALAGMLGSVVAAIDCCEEHATLAEKVVVEVFKVQLALNRARFAAMERAGVHHQEGHA